MKTFLAVLWTFWGCTLFTTEILSQERFKESRGIITAVKPIAEVRKHESFADLRHEILGIIGGATKRLWLLTPYLNDGEIASSLYMAKYRKIDVKVLLGRGRANHYMSRLKFLKKQNIPVFLEPSKFQYRGQTAIISDDRLVFINGSLDFRATRYRYVSREKNETDTDKFVKAFALATDQKIPAIPRPTPRVGRPGRFRQVYSRTPRSAPDKPREPRYTADGAYDYNQKRPDREEPGMPKKLPKRTIQQKKFMKEYQNNKN